MGIKKMLLKYIIMARGGSNGGIGGSGVFGLFGSTVTCKSDDNSYYCWFHNIDISLNL